LLSQFLANFDPMRELIYWQGAFKPYACTIIAVLAVSGSPGAYAQSTIGRSLAPTDPACSHFSGLWSENTGDRALVEIAITKLTNEAFKPGPANDTLLKRYRDLIERRQADRSRANDAAFDAKRAGCDLPLPPPTLAEGAEAGNDFAAIAILNKVLGDRQ
jgi:hypothetical protein